MERHLTAAKVRNKIAFSKVLSSSFFTLPITMTYSSLIPTFSVVPSFTTINHRANCKNLRPRRPRPTNLNICSRPIIKANMASPTSSKDIAETEKYPLFDTLFTNNEDVQVFLSNGEKISLLDYVKELTGAGNVVLIGWLRHFGCSLCLKQSSDWKKILPELHSLGSLSVALVGNGPPEHAAMFKEQLQWDGDIFTDPDRKTYNVLKFRKGVSTTFNLPALGKVIKSIREGNKQTWSRIPTDAFQQGGALLIDRNRLVHLYHIDTFAGDHIDTDKLVEEVKVVLTK